MRVGIGYDVHALQQGEELILGGVKIKHELGLVGHSDADVSLHAIIDALLGAVGEGDIGRQFPDDDPQYKGISSLILLDEVGMMMNKKGYKVNNLDVVIKCQQPKLAPYLNRMEENITEVLQVDLSRINIKATTTEELGFVGRKKGIATEAIVSLKEEE